MAKQKYKEVLIATREEGEELYQKLVEAGKLEKAIELTKNEAEKMTKKARILSFIVIGWILPYGLKASKLWQGVYYFDKDFELKGKSKWAYLYGWCYTYLISFCISAGLFVKQSYPKILVPLD